jgi:hypothetical protein
MIMPGSTRLSEHWLGWDAATLQIGVWAAHRIRIKIVTAQLSASSRMFN